MYKCMQTLSKTQWVRVREPLELLSAFADEFWLNDAGDGVCIEAWTGDARWGGGGLGETVLWDEEQASGGLWLRREGGECGCQSLNNDPVQSAPALESKLRTKELSHPICFTR